MPGHIHPDDLPASATPLIIAQSTTHVVVAVEIAKAALVSHRRALAQLIAAADESRAMPAAAGQSGATPAGMAQVAIDLSGDEAMALDATELLRGLWGATFGKSNRREG
jgi:hypothetical protein